MLLEVRNLSIDFKTSRGQIQALRDVSFQLSQGESLGFVGESGSGKSVTSLAIFDLLASNAVLRSGEILFQGRDILKMSEAEKQKIRGKDIAMIFQDPMTSLNPSFTVEYQIGEVLTEHLGLEKHQVRERTLELLSLVGIPDPQARLKTYPHELSGGMSQRVMIAMAIACNPKVLIADEPTTALDVTIQKQILSLLGKLRRELKMSLILVSHDLGVIAQNTDRIMVMYAGEVVETGESKGVIQGPMHPYTEGLLKCLPALHVHEPAGFRLPTISGIVPNLAERPQGCQLAPRCQYRQKNCEQVAVPTTELPSQKRQVRCFYPLQASKEIST
ncbi:MAG: ABC transporter ATP-binding protein [Proteobacteria bacterium]|jgi:dipeptide transport system ATP-binding protein|nr:ABC transporter ATP-binding protein [Pseudomonadota bacterium]